MKRYYFGAVESGFFGNLFSKRISCAEKGFSYIEVMIALVILLVGVLQMASALSANLLRSYETEKRIVSKQIALSTIESIISARDIARTGAVEGWDSIGNVGSNPVEGSPRGIFLTGWCPIREDLGWDGVAGTSDDACAENSTCNVSDRPPNTSAVVKGYQRQIIITDVADTERPSPPYPIARRRIDVNIKYFYNSIARTETVSTIVANY
jgi:prepilin-type N-terminal cleavage/methylation domain-containing protein